LCNKAYWKETIHKESMGTTVHTLTISRANEVLIPVAPAGEQARIVAKVYELMALCDRLEAEQADAEAAHAKLVEALLASLTQARDAADFRASWQQLAEHFHTLFTTEASVEALKQTVFQLGALGKLAVHVREPDPRHASTERICAEDEPFSLPPAWRWVRLGSLCKLVTSGSRGWKEFYADSGSTFIRSQDIKLDKLEFDNRAFVRLPPSAEGARTLVAIDDLLVTITGANVGKAAHLTEPVEDAYVSQHVALIRLRDPALSPFVHRWLTNSHGGRAKLLASSYGAKPGLNLQNIKDLPIPLPPVVEQREIVAKIDELLDLCAQLKLNLAQALQQHERLASVLIEQAVA
jgi:type I restriction enzyme S subunit